MRQYWGFMGFVVFVGLCFAGGCRKEEPTPGQPKAKATAKPDKTLATTSGVAATRPGEKPAAAGATKAAGPKRGPIRVGETRAGQGARSKKPKPSAKGRRQWSRPPTPDMLFSCTSCQATFIVPGEQAREQLSQAYRKRSGKRPEITCTQCGKVAATPAIKCEQCDAIIVGPEEYPKGRRGLLPDKFYDECKACGYSKMRDGMVKRLKRAMKRGRFDPNEARGLNKQAIEDAKARGEWDE